MEWWIWLLIAVAAFVGESATMALYLLYFGIAAVVVAALALTGVVAVVQLVVFLVLSVGLLGVVRPRTLRLLGRRVPSGMLTNQGVRPDREAIVEAEVSATTGMIRLGNAEFWTARTYEQGMNLPPGTRVRVVYVDGLTAYVEPLMPASATGPGGDPERSAGGDDPASESPRLS